MTIAGILTLATVMLAVLALTPPLGGYIHAAMEGRPTVLSPFLGPIERGIYRVTRIDPQEMQSWRAYTASLLVFTFVSIAALYLIQRFQGVLPLNPTGAGPVAPELAFNTAVSFSTTTDWQNYAGETGVSQLTQMMGLTVQNFLAAAGGLAAAAAVARGLGSRRSLLGNFWVDLTRATLYVLLPISVVGAVLLVAQGVPETLSGPHTVTTLQGASQTLIVGPIASQDVIKILGSNGGGYLNANGAHPFLNPTGLSDWLDLVLNLLVPFALTYTFGRYVRDARQGWALFAVMAVILVAASLGSMALEGAGNPLLPASVDQAAGNMEGKEVRIGAEVGGMSAAQMAATTTGAPPVAYASLSPASGGVAMALMLTGEVAPGGVGSGITGILVYVILAVFLGGLMVGRTPEYLGKRVESHETRLLMLAVLVPAIAVLGLVALSVSVPPGQAGPANPPPRGFSEVLYAFASMNGNNGSAFASFSGNTVFYNVVGSFAMLAGRFGTLIPMLAIAGSMGPKRQVPRSLGTLPTGSALFAAFLGGTIIIVGALSYLAALALGPIAEHLAMLAGHTTP
jgi:potassium-transporting ATPase potassium-binding subunit